MLKKYHLGDFYLVLNTVAGRLEDNRRVNQDNQRLEFYWSQSLHPLHNCVVWMLMLMLILIQMITSNYYLISSLSVELLSAAPLFAYISSVKEVSLWKWNKKPSEKCWNKPKLNNKRATAYFSVAELESFLLHYWRSTAFQFSVKKLELWRTGRTLTQSDHGAGSRANESAE